MSLFVGLCVYAIDSKKVAFPREILQKSRANEQIIILTYLVYSPAGGNIRFQSCPTFRDEFVNIPGLAHKNL